MNRLHRILIAIQVFPPDFTGSGLRALRFAQRMIKRYNTRFTVICLNIYKRSSRNLDYSQLRINRIKSIRLRNIYFPFFLISLYYKLNNFLIINNRNIDIIHFYSFPWFNRVLALINLLKYKKKMILEVTLDNNDDPINLLENGIKNRLLKPITAYILKNMDLFIVQTDKGYDSCLNVEIDKDKIWQRPNPADEKVFAHIEFSQKNKLRRKLKLRNRFTILHVGIIQPRKNQLFLCKCIKHLREYDLQLILIGPKDPLESSYFDKVADFIEKNKLQDRIFLLGEKKNINEYMIASDLFVFPSYNEGFGNVLSESIMSGLPVLSFPLSGISKYMNSKVGMTIKIVSSERNNILNFSNKIRNIYLGEIQFNRDVIRKYGVRHFSTKEADLKYHKIYSNLLN